MTAQFKQKLETISKKSELIETTCNQGSMPFRIWRPDGDEGITGEVLVLLHGGSGSWTHWVRNIEALSTYYEVIVPDLPGLGDAASLAEGYQPQDAVDWVAKGIEQIIGDRRYHLVAFSWGCVVASLLAAMHGNQVKSQILVGPASMGEMPRRILMKPLIPRTATMTAEEIHNANKENLARLMIYDRRKVDEFAVYLQTENTDRARFRSPRFGTGTFVLDGLKQAIAPLLVLYGEFDAAAYPNIPIREEKLHEIRSDVQFEVVPGTGHWMQYEAAALFNTRCVGWVEDHII